MPRFNFDPEQELGEFARRGDGNPGPLADMVWMEPRLEAFYQWLHTEHTIEGGTVMDNLMLAHNFHLILLQMLELNIEREDVNWFYRSASDTFQMGCEDQAKRAAAKHDGPPR